MKRTLWMFATVVLTSAAPVASAATIRQSPDSSSVAFEAEENVVLVPGTPTSFVITNDVTPSGNKALYAAGANNTGFPSSFASYNIRFATPGTYKVYFRWRANQLYTDADPNSANSFYAPKGFNSSTDPVIGNTDYTVSTVNNTRVRPESNSYHVDAENTSLVTVSQEQVDAGVPLVFTVGTREAGMMFDRFVLTSDPSLTEAQFNGTPNSETDVFVQPPGADYVAFEAESSKGSIIGGTPTGFVITNDVTPSGNTALYAAGANNTGFPSSFCSYSIKFNLAGTYKLFFRWRANQLYTDADPNAANSFYAPTRFNSSTNPINPNPDYTISTVNNTRVRPESNTYHVDSENASLLTVSQEQVDAGDPLLFTLGTREAGMMFDRIVLSLNQALTESQFNALENTGAAIPPQIAAAVGSASLLNVKVTFTKAMDQFSLDPANFQLNGGVTVQEALLDPVTLKDVILTTTPQAEGFQYTLTVNGVNDLGGNFIAPNSTVQFYAWQLAHGFSRREYYFTITGTDIASLTSSPKYPGSPDRVDVSEGLSSVNDPRAQNYGVRLTGFFIPDQPGVYDFFMYNDNEAQLSLSPDDSAANLQVILNASTSPAMAFDAAVVGTSPTSLVSGQRYFIQVLLKQGTDYDTFVNVAARRQGDATPVAQLPPLGGNRIAALVDPATAVAQITKQPLATSISAGRRVRFEVAAQSAGGPPFYQWQVNGQDIPGATRAAYYTPVLGQADSGTQYRCVIHAGGAIVTSSAAAVTVTAGPAPASAPLVAANFVGGDAAGASGSLRASDVLGVVPQGNWNNLTGGAGTEAPLVDAAGLLAPITISYSGITYFTGSGERTAEDVLFQGYLHGANLSVSATLNHVPPGAYDLYAYSVGFNFNATYEQAMSLVGAVAAPTFHVRAEHAGNYAAAPGIFRRMSSTDPGARDQGNYVVFQGVSPDPSGALALTVVNESDNPLDIDVTPALSGLQLVQVPPGISIAIDGAGVSVSWGASAAGFILEASRSLGGPTPANWGPAAGAPNPLTGSGALSVSLGGGAEPVRFFRLRQP